MEANQGEQKVLQAARDDEHEARSEATEQLNELRLTITTDGQLAAAFDGQAQPISTREANLQR